MLKKIKKVLTITMFVSLAVLVVTMTIRNHIPTNKVKPRLTSQFAKTSVMIVDREMTAGGSGFVLSSNEKGSIILTNKHVCELVYSGGDIMSNDVRYPVTEIKPYKRHDLCAIKIAKNLGLGVNIAKTEPVMYSDAAISGHPNLFPHVLTRGAFSGKRQIQIITGFKECTGQETGQDMLYCIFMGGIPIATKYNTQLVSATILPGSSGSAVFNDQGEIGGLAFASGSESLNYAFIVPHAYVVDFINNESQYKWLKVSPKNPKGNFIKKLFKFKSICSKKEEQFKSICEAVKTQSILEL